jgi:hypothetical protein
MRRPFGVKWVLLFFRWTRFFSRRVAITVATLPSALFNERFVSFGASWVFSFQPVLPPNYRPFFCLTTEVGHAINAVTGTRRLSFSFRRTFLTLLPAGQNAYRYATVRRLLRSPTNDAARPPAYAPSDFTTTGLLVSLFRPTLLYSPRLAGHTLLALGTQPLD